MKDSEIKEGKFFDESERVEDTNLFQYTKNQLNNKEVKKMEEKDQNESVDAKKESQDSQERKIEVIDVDITKLPEVESEHKDLIDFEKHRLEKCEIESAEIVKIPSKFAKAEDGKEHKLKIIGKVVETITVEDSKTKEKKTIEFRPTALVGMIEEEDGTLKGFPASKDSTWHKVKTTLQIEKVEELIGKSLPMSITQKSEDAPKYLGFMLG